MKKIFRKLNLSAKVVLSMTTLICIYSIIFVVISMRNTETELYDQISATSSRSLEQFNNSLDTLQANLINISSLVYTNDTIMDIVKGAKSMGSTRSQNDMDNFLIGSLLFNSSFDFAGITNSGTLSDSRYSVNDTSFGLNSYKTLLKSPIFQDFQKSGRDYGTYILPKDDTSIIRQNRNDKLLFLRTIRNPQHNFDLIGYLILGVNLTKITEFCSPFLDTDNSGIYIFDETNTEIYSIGKVFADKKEWQSIAFDKGTYRDRKDGRYLVCGTNRNCFHWRIFYYMDISEIIPKNFWNSYAYLILIALAAVSVFFIIATLFTKTLVGPLKELLKSLEKLQQGDFEQHVSVRNQDEIGRLTEGYNQMVMHIRNLIKQNYEIKIREKEAQLGALQAQINPHFLYNTLDLLYWKASMSGQEEISNHIYSMSKLFRLSLNKGEMWLTLEQEKEFLTHYLNLQKALMSEKLDYCISVEEFLLQTKIPRFLFQPFVENAILHGFKKITAVPKLTIFFQSQKKDLLVFICDNGCGMDQEKANMIFSGINEESADTKENYAICNVLKRMELYFGENFSLTVKSEISKGTKIKLCVRDYLEQSSK